MTIKKTIVSILLAGGCAMGAFAQNGLNDPMTKAMMEVYDQEITANPQAYDVYFVPTNTTSSTSIYAHYPTSTAQSNMPHRAMPISCSNAYHCVATSTRCSGKPRKLSTISPKH